MNTTASEDELPPELRGKRVRKKAKQEDRLPPHSIEAEKGVLGCIMLCPDECLAECVEQFKSNPDVFYDLRHQQIFKAMLSLWKEKKEATIDLIVIQQRLKDRDALEGVGGMAYLCSLPDSVPSAHNLSSYVATVLEKFECRKVIQACTNAVAQVYEHESEIDRIRKETETALSESETHSVEVLDSAGCVDASEQDLDRRIALQGKLTGIATGITRFDICTSGLQFGEQTIIGARPSVGKTAFALRATLQAALRDSVPTLFVTLEMSPSALMRRIQSMELNIPLKKIRDGTLSKDELLRIRDFNRNVYRKAPLHIANGVRGMNTDAFGSTVRRYVRKHGIRFVVVDYLQKMKSVGRFEKRTYEVGDVSSECKAIASANQVAMMMLAQLNRDSVKEDRSPRLSDLGDSKQIEQDGDLIGLLDRKRTEKDPQGHSATLFIAKQRDGELDVIPMHYEARFVRFENPKREEMPTEEIQATFPENYQ